FPRPAPAAPGSATCATSRVARGVGRWTARAPAVGRAAVAGGFRIPLAGQGKDSWFRSSVGDADVLEAQLGGVASLDLFVEQQAVDALRGLLETHAAEAMQ